MNRFLPPIDDKTFTYEHLFDSPSNELLIQDFTVKNPAGKNLARFLKELAPHNETSNADRTYLVKDKVSGEIAGYFALRTGLFALNSGNGRIFTVPSVELSNFAVNDSYRKSHPDIRKVGATIFNKFVMPLVKHIQMLTGVQALYIYALPEDRLIDHYSTFGFSRLSKEDEQFVYDRVKPAYDANCIFMYQIL